MDANPKGWKIGAVISATRVPPARLARWLDRRVIRLNGRDKQTEGSVIIFDSLFNAFCKSRSLMS